MNTEQKIATAMIPDERVCIQPVGTTGVWADPGCPVIEDANLPDPVLTHSRHILTNPFGANTPVLVEAEIFASGEWAPTGFIYTASATSGGYGVSANYVQNVGVVVVSGSAYIATGWGFAGGGHSDAGAPASAPVRIFVTRGKQ